MIAPVVVTISGTMESSSKGSRECPTRQLNALRNCELHIASAGWKIQNEQVQFRPADLE